MQSSGGQYGERSCINVLNDRVKNILTREAKMSGIQSLDEIEKLDESRDHSKTHCEPCAMIDDAGKM